MSIDATVLRALLAAGATAEMIVSAVEAAAAADEAKKAEKRKQDAQRQAKSRANRKLSRDVTVTGRDICDEPSSPLDGPLSFPQTPNLSPLNPPTTSETGGAAEEILDAEIVGDEEPNAPTEGEQPEAVIIDLNERLAETPARGTRLPEDWQLTEDLTEFARKEGLSDAQIEREFARFRDHWLGATGRGATKRRWDTTWRNWVRTAVDRLSRSRGSSPSGHGTQAGGRLGAMHRALAKVAHSDPFSE